jgi:hypothetical protein
MANKNIKKIVKELGKFYDIKQTVVLNESDNTNNLINNKTVYWDFLEHLEQNNYNALDEQDDFISTLLSKSTSTPTYAAIKEELNKNPNVIRPLLITPLNSDSDLQKTKVLNTVKNTGQGYIPSNNTKLKEFNLVDAIPDFERNANNTELEQKLVAFQIFSPKDTITSVDADATSLFMNSISSFEASRAIPYLEIHIASAVTAEFGELDNSNYTFLGRFMLPDKHKMAKNDQMFNAHWPDIEIKGPDIGQAADGFQKAYKILGGMESFTMPQTAVNADYAYKTGGGIQKREILDPFQPLMSIESLKINVIPQTGLMSHKTGKLDIVVHDRARLNELTSMIAPDQIGTTHLLISYGYNHPDGRSFARPSMAEKERHLIGEFIDSMKVTEVFHVTSPQFSFDESSVKVSLSLSMIGGRVFENMELNDIFGHNEKTKEVLKQLQTFNDILIQKMDSQRKTGINQIVKPSFLDNPSMIGSADHNKLLEDLYKLKKSIEKDKTQVGILNSLFGHVKKPKKDDTLGGLVGEIIEDTAKNIEVFIKKLKKTPDPFLPESHDFNVDYKSNREKGAYVSLGKIFSSVIGLAINTRFHNDTEFQLYFHPFNASAAGMQDYNTSQFYIEYKEFEEILLHNFSPFGTMTLARFFRMIQDFFINDMGSAPYSILSDKERETFFRNPNSKNQRTRRRVLSQRERQELKEAREKIASIDEELNYGREIGMTIVDQERKEEDLVNERKRLFNTRRRYAGEYDDEAFSKYLDDKKVDRLRRVYFGNNINEFESLNFRTPQLSVMFDSIPGRDKWNDSINPKTSHNKVVVKIHVFDRTCDNMYTVPELLRTIPGRIVIPSIRNTRANNNFLFASNHQKYANIPITKLYLAGLIKPFIVNEAELLIIKNQLMLDKNAVDFIRGMQGQIGIIDCEQDKVNTVIKSLYPFLLYGSETSGILKASVSSMNDSSLTTIMIIRDGKGEIKGNPGRDGVPISVMPVSLNLQTLGCPFFSYSQMYFVDMGTNTNIDNVYAVSGIEHELSPGKFSTSLKMVWLDSFAVFRPLTQEMKISGLRAILLQLGKLKR